MLNTFITVEKLEEKHACRSGIDFFAQVFPEGATLIDAAVKLTQMGRFNYACWLLIDILGEPRCFSWLKKILVCRFCFLENAYGVCPTDYTDRFLIMNCFKNISNFSSPSSFSEKMRTHKSIELFHDILFENKRELLKEKEIETC